MTIPSRGDDVDWVVLALRRVVVAERDDNVRYISGRLCPYRLARVSRLLAFTAFDGDQESRAEDPLGLRCGWRQHRISSGLDCSVAADAIFDERSGRDAFISDVCNVFKGSPDAHAR